MSNPQNRRRTKSSERHETKLPKSKSTRRRHGYLQGVTSHEVSRSEIRLLISSFSWASSSYIQKSFGASPTRTDLLPFRLLHRRAHRHGYIRRPPYPRWGANRRARIAATPKASASSALRISYPPLPVVPRLPLRNAP